jgi:hypothetical protein
MMLKVIAIATIVLVASVTSETEFGSRIPEHELAQQEETPKSALIEAEEMSLFEEASGKLTTLLATGKGEKGCINGGRAAIQEVLKEKGNAQAVLNRMPNGSKCLGKRASFVRAARARLAAAKTALRNAQRAYNKSSNQKVSVSISWKAGQYNCNTFRAASAWKRHGSLVNRRKRDVSAASTRVSSARNGLAGAIRKQKLAQCKCRRQVIANANNALKNAKKLTGTRKRMIRRELLLICLAKARGKKVNVMNACKNKSLPSSYSSKLTLHRTKLINWGNRFQCRKHRGAGKRATNDRCKGFFIPKSCNGQIAFERMQTNNWSRYATYKCPLGWKWASTTEYANKVNKLRRTGHKCNGYAYYGRCQSGYPGSQYYFRFSNSRSNCKYQHAGSYITPGGSATGCGTGNNAGIVCIQA